MLLEETDRELIAACQRGERDAFRALFDTYKDRVFSIALRYTGDPTAAQDIAQDSFLKVFSGIDKFRGDSGFESWLYRLVVNSCFDQKRRTRRLTPLVEELFSGLRATDTSALDEVLRSERGSQVRAVVRGLPAEQRMMIVLRYTQGLSYEEIGEALGCPPGTVASRLNRLHKVLERRLSSLVSGTGRERA